MYKLNSIFWAGLIIILIQPPPSYTKSPPHYSNTSISSNPMRLFRTFKVWLWGPDGTIVVHRRPKKSGFFGFLGGGGASGSVITVNMEPEWSMFSLLFPQSGMEGVLVKASPPHACFDLRGPPSLFSSVESMFGEPESNFTSSSVTSIVNTWILVAEDGHCDYNTKIRNADMAGYSLLIIRQGPDSFDENGNSANSTIIDSNTTSTVNIYTCTVEDTDGYHLVRYSYPSEHTALVQDLRKMQWINASFKLISISFGTTVVVAGTFILVKEVAKKLQKNKEAKDKAAVVKVENARNRIANNLPRQKWRSNLENYRHRCKWCHRRLEHDEEVTTLDCSHTFHKTCLVPRILRGHGYCPICQAQIHSPPTPEPPPPPPLQKPGSSGVDSIFTETTPLLVPDKSKNMTMTSKPTESRSTDTGTGLKYHCNICEILGLSLKDELELVDALARQVGTLHSSHYEYRIPSRHTSLDGSASTSVSISVTDLADDEAADAEVQRITGNPVDADLAEKLHGVMDIDEEP